MATLTVQEAPIVGLDDITFEAADAAGDDVATGAAVLLLVKNDDASPHTATIDTPGTVRGLDIENPDVVVPAGGIGAMPLVRSVFNATAQITYDDVTSVSVAAVRLEQ